jgi:hypothetical protein
MPKLTKPKPLGRPSKYSPEIAEYICEQLSEGIPLREICRQPGMPSWRVVYDWMYRDEALSAAIAKARDLGYDAIAEDCLRIADNPEYGTKTVEGGKDGPTVTTEDMLGHRKLRVWTRLQLLAKFNPARYGDRVGLHGVDNAPPIKTEDATYDKLLAILSNMEMKKRAGD